MNQSIRHGLSVGTLRLDERIFLSFKAVGKLTHEDYEILNPMIDSAIRSVESPHVRVLIDSTELQGWEPRAAWDDFRLGLRHGRDFEKIAIVGDQRWQQVSAKVGSWFISGEVRFFADESEALAWLAID